MLVLIKYVLKEIQVFWHTLAHIPKGILEKIMKCCFNYLWKGRNEFNGSHLAKWKLIATPKKRGGQELEDIHLFGLSSVVNSLWQLITKDIS